MKQTIELADESVSLAFGNKLAQALIDSDLRLVVIYLQGDLGAGKTTLSRGILHGFGFQGQVKSPTYTLVEPYELETVNVYHFDLYRLGDPEELEFMGIRDYFESPQKDERPVICIIEWPERGMGYVPKADLDIRLSINKLGRLADVVASDDLLIAPLEEK